VSIQRRKPACNGRPQSSLRSPAAARSTLTSRLSFKAAALGGARPDVGGVTSLYSDNRQSGVAMRLVYGQPVLEPVKLRAGHAIARSAVALSIISCALAASTTAMSLI
jgi:hypothetical protein